jgi:hypothetical protein
MLFSFAGFENSLDKKLFMLGYLAGRESWCSWGLQFIQEFVKPRMLSDDLEKILEGIAH